MNIANIDDNAFKLVLALVVSTFASLKVLDAITSRIKRGKNGEALKQTGAVCLIVLMLGTTVAGLWVGYSAIHAEPPQSSPPAPTPAPPAPLKKSNGHASGKRDGRSGKHRPTVSPVQPSQVTPSSPSTQPELKPSPPVMAPTPTPPPVPKTGTCANTPPLP